jgi:uncharacterized protein
MTSFIIFPWRPECGAEWPFSYCASPPCTSWLRGYELNGVSDMTDVISFVVPAGHGHAFELPLGASATVSLTHGPQVVDVWAFFLPDLTEFISCEHTRSCLEKLRPAVGDALYSNRRRPLLTITEDTSPGAHDLLLSACDTARYALLGHEGPHRNCADNLREALAELDREPPEIPSPFNLFQNVTVDEEGRLEIQPPMAAKGDHITLRAEQNIILVLSSCPMDIAPTNGADRQVKPVTVLVTQI